MAVLYNTVEETGEKTHKNRMPKNMLKYGPTGRRVSGQRHAPATLYPRVWNPLDGRLSGPQSCSGHKLEEKILCLCRGPNPGHPVCNETL
jgi:hypothetical protein